MGELRGLKRDVWEGGHHVPFIVKWPNKIKKGIVNNDLISQVDIMATLCEVINIKTPEGSAMDSKSFLPILIGEKNQNAIRKSTIHNTYKGMWGVRNGKWLFINKNTGQVTKMPESYKKLRGYEDFSTPGLLFNLDKDIEQAVNLYEQYPEEIEKMKDILKEELDKGYSQ